MDYQEIAHSWFTEMWSEPNLALADQIVAPTYHPSWMSMEERGPALLKKEITYFRSIFPDLTYTIKASTQDGQRVWIWYHGKGTHLSEGWGLEPTGKKTEQQRGLSNIKSQIEHDKGNYRTRKFYYVKKRHAYVWKKLRRIHAALTQKIA
ncbi:MAG: ester cyclase, partial [Promethearchaeota archaeon]